MSGLPAPPPRDPDPVNAAGLIYRILSRWRVLLGAVIGVAAAAVIIVLAVHFVGPVRIEIGPIGFEPLPHSMVVAE